MKLVGGFFLALLLSTGLLAQNRSGFVNPGGIGRTFPGVVFPGGSSALPGVQRFTPSAVFPGGGVGNIGVPGIRPNGIGYGRYGGGRRHDGYYGGNFGGGYAYPVAVPVYVGGYGYGGYDTGLYDQPPAPPVAPQQPPANVIVIYPPAPAPAAAPAQPTMIEVPPPQQQPGAQPAAQDTSTGETPTHYLIAFKDHSIYSAVAYWVQGDTLHYFTTGNTHNQVSLSLVDRDLTKRLNEESGLQVNLPPAK